MWISSLRTSEPFLLKIRFLGMEVDEGVASSLWRMGEKDFNHGGTEIVEIGGGRSRRGGFIREYPCDPRFNFVFVYPSSIHGCDFI